MNQWSDEARNELERFLVAERGWLASDPDSVDVDHQEVIADLRAHVHEELQVAGVGSVGVEELHQVLQTLRPGFGTRNEVRPTVPEDRESATRRKRRRKQWSARESDIGPTNQSVHWIFGVVLPLLALFIESTSGALEDAIDFSPIPGILNVVLIALIPAMNAIMLVRNRSQLGPITMGFVGAALATSLLYSIIFLPLIPLGLIMIIFMGIGFLVLSPQASLLVTWSLLRRSQSEGAAKGALVGGVLATLALMVSTLLPFVTHIGADWAMDEDPDVQARGLSTLRSLGSEALLLDYCYGIGNSDSAFTGGFWFVRLLENRLIEPPTVDEARELYYLTTGQAYNSVDPPSHVLDELQNRGWDSRAWRRRNMEERARGGTDVAGRIKDLKLVESRMDAQLETEAALFYLEWELEFANGTEDAHEARAQVQLPPGGYVSRLTLWVNGEEREAAFDKKGKVREAYQDVAIVQRRDPVLVTYSGVDQVLLQCFPVPAGGKLRTRVGITAPLLIAPTVEGQSSPEGALSLPRFVERNFALPSQLEHQVWLQGRGEYLALPAGLTAANPGGGALLARGSLSASELDNPGAATRVQLAGLAPESWATAVPQGADPTQSKESEFGIVQSFVEVESEPVQRLILVVDGGAGLGEAGKTLATSLDSLPTAVQVGLLVAGASSNRLEAPGAAGPEHLKALKLALHSHEYVGGVNAAPTLARAFDLAQEQPGSAVIWLHGALPVTFSGTAALEQRLERSVDGTRIHALAAAPGINRVIAEHGSKVPLIVAPRMGALADDLARLFRELTLGSKRLEPVRERMGLESLPDGAQVATHQLTRLWAGDEATRLQLESRASERKRGVDLALAYHLVTPGTGAVVLETQAQFDRAGLQPVSIDEVPSVPEPEMIALLVMAAALLGIVVMRGRVVG